MSVDFDALPTKIVCPHCGSDGSNSERWEGNGPAPFRIIEQVLHTWPIERFDLVENRIVIVVEGGADSVDYESTGETEIECLACFGQFAVTAPFEMKWL